MAIALIITRYLLIKKTKIPNLLFLISTFLILLIAYYRWVSNRYIFCPYEHVFPVKYIDLVFIIYECLFFLKLNSWVNPEQGPKYTFDSFLIDVPIISGDKDIFSRKAFSKELAIKIQSRMQEASGSLAIGINGTWGSGKTSFMNMIKENLHKKNRIIIDFNPWRSASSSKIIEDFFELLISEIQKYDPELSDNITKYAKTLTKINKNFITESLETITEFLFKSPNKNESYNLINESILKTKKQIIIFIDDLDRLDLNELMEVLRLIRNTANFKNVAYIVAYDKGYILEAVKKFNTFNYKTFLEKIFQFEFLLPSYESSILKNQIKLLLKKKMRSAFSIPIDAAVDYAGISGKNITNRIISTQRDVIRLCNSLLFEINEVKYEVNFIDFYFVQLLKLKFSGVYKAISEYKELFFITEKSLLRLRTLNEKNINEEFLNTLRLLDEKREVSKPGEEKETIFEEYIHGNTSEELSQIEKDIIVEIVKEILREKELREGFESKDYKSFVYSGNFHKYFSIQLLETDLSADEFEKHRTGDFEAYKKKMFQWIDQGHVSEILDKLEKIVDFSNKNEWENHLLILLEIGKYQFNKNGPYGINYREIIDVLNYPDKRTQTLFFDDKVAYINYVREFFTNAHDPFTFEGGILTAALTHIVRLPLSDKEIEDFLLGYFKKYCAAHKEITADFRELYRNAVTRKSEYGSELVPIPEAKELFILYFRTYLKSSELGTFIRQIEPGVELFEIQREWLNVFFPSWTDFEKYLETAENVRKEMPPYSEFLSFYDKLKSNSYNPIKFEFNLLRPTRWATRD